MKFVLSSAILTAGILAGCAANPVIPTGMKSGEFVSFSCAGGKSFQARASTGGETVRLRYEGGYELDNKGAGVYEAEGWRLVTQGAESTELMHNGKSVLKNCKVA